MVKKTQREIILATVLFALYIFVFLLTELTINARAAAVLCSGYTVRLYAVGLLCTSFGYVSFHFSRAAVAKESARKRLIVAVIVAYMACVFCFLHVTSAALFAASALASLLLFGYIGGFIHYTVSLFLFGKSYSGRILGSAVAVATVLQFIVQNLLIVDAALIISLMVSVVVILYLAVKPVEDWMFENPLPYASKSTITVKHFVVPICVVAVMSLSFGLADGLVTQLDAVGVVVLSSRIRLLYALGVFLAGIVADIDKRRFLPLCTLILLFLFSCMALFIEDGNAFAGNVYICMMYLFSGFYVMYLTVMFLDTAPMAEKTSLWAGMGRIVRGPCIALTAVLSAPIRNLIGLQGISVVGVCLSVVVLLFMLATGQLNIRPEKAAALSGRMAEFVETYQLTPREAEIFSLLLDNDATNKDVAAELLLSVRVLERYITSIYKKVGVATRIELMDLYYGKTLLKAAAPLVASADKNGVSVLSVPTIPEEKLVRLSLQYGLTKRETELLAQLYLRKTNEDIAAALGVTENTIKFHLKNLMKKMSVSSRNAVREMLEDK